MMSFLFRWLVLSVAVFVAAQLSFTGIHYDSWESLVVAALLLGVANAVVRPTLLLLSLPLIIVTLGLFVWVLNGLLLYAVSQIVEGFHVPDFWSALIGSLVISGVTMLFEGLNKKKPERRSKKYRGQGKVIDI